MEIKVKEGLGHQYKKDERAINACNSSLSKAYDDLTEISNPDVDILKFDIQKLINRCITLAYSAREAQKQDN